MSPSFGQRYLRAFVSSTYVDLAKHRRWVIDQLRRSGLVVDPMEDWTADGDEPQAFSQQRIEDCDLCVRLVANGVNCCAPGTASGRLGWTRIRCP